MARYQQNWDDLGRDIQRIVDQAVYSRDFKKMNQTIRQTVSRAVDMGSEAVRKVTDNHPHPPQPPQPPEPPRPPEPPKVEQPVLYGKTGGQMVQGIAQIVGGCVVGGLSLVGIAVSMFAAVLPGMVAAAPVIPIIGLAAGGTLIGCGIHGLTRMNRFRVYRRMLGNNTHCNLEKLAGAVGKSVKFVRKELQKMIGQGLFLQGHLDQEKKVLITSHETYHYYEQSRLLLESQQKEAARQAEQEKKAAEEKKAVEAKPQEKSGKTAQEQEVLERGNAFIKEIRRCNDAIPGELISAKIDRMEIIVRKIFERAEAHPEIIPDLKKLMDYYLPMTVKLLNVYADIDAQPVQGENIQSSKREIEDTLDTLNLAFEKLLDSVFADTALDVSSDISVLQTLLAQEGLTQDDFETTT